jgi:hypothetical protein
MIGRVARSLAIVALVSSFAQASDGPIERATLRGLKALRVAVDPTDEQLQRAGVTVAKVATMVEQQLQKAGLATDENAIEFLGVRITAAHAKKQSSAVCLSLGLYQNVTLARDTKIKAITETWSGDSVVLSPPQLFFEAVSSTINQLVDQFVVAYRAANAKE